MTLFNELFNFDQCSECQLVFLNPRVSPDDLKKYYTSHYLPYRGSKAWGKFEKLVENSQQKLDLRRVKRTKATHNISPDSLILDVGCGKPSFLKACQQELSCRTLGIDFSDEGWKGEDAHFLGIDFADDDNAQTKHFLDMCKSFSNTVVQEQHGKQEQADFLSTTLGYFAEKDIANPKEFEEQVFLVDDDSVTDRLLKSIQKPRIAHFDGAAYTAKEMLKLLR